MVPRCGVKSRKSRRMRTSSSIHSRLNVIPLWCSLLAGCGWGVTIVPEQHQRQKREAGPRSHRWGAGEGGGPSGWHKNAKYQTLSPNFCQRFNFGLILFNLLCWQNDISKHSYLTFIFHKHKQGMTILPSSVGFVPYGLEHGMDSFLPTGMGMGMNLHLWQ